MTLSAEVKDDGTLVTKVPKSLRGKRVKIVIQEQKSRRRKSEKIDSKKKTSIQDNKALKSPEAEDNKESLAQWEKISAIINAAKELDIPRRTSEEILHDLYVLRGANN
jgi:hypothetical protein